MNLAINVAKSGRDHVIPSLLYDAGVIFLSALVVRLVWALLAPEFDPFLQASPLHGDAASYDRIAQSLLSGTGFSERPPQPTSFWPPLYPWFLSVIYWLAGYNLAVARLSQTFLGALVPLLLYLVAVKTLSRRVALLTSIGLTLYPYLIYFGTWLIAESLFMALFAVALWLTSRLIGKWHHRTIALLGLLLGLCVLTKPTTLFFTPFWALWLFAAPQNMNLWRRSQLALLLAFCTVAVILPWSIRNYRVHNQFVLVSTNGGYTFLGANNPNGWGGHDEDYPPLILTQNEAESEDAYYAEALHWIRSDPNSFIRLLVPKYRRLLSPLSVASFKQDYHILGAPLIYLVYSTYLLIAITGMVIGLKVWRKIGFLYAPILGVLLSAGLFYGDTRYTIPMSPSLVLFAALALDYYSHQVREKKWHTQLV